MVLPAGVSFGRFIAAFTCVEPERALEPARSSSSKNAAGGAPPGDVLSGSWEAKRRPRLIGRRRVFSALDRGPARAQHRWTPGLIAGLEQRQHFRLGQRPVDDAVVLQLVRD